MMEAAIIIEMDAERDRKTCIALDLKVTGANRELAQWLVDHPRYSGRTVSEWLGCGETRIRELRQWAKRNFAGLPHARPNNPSKAARRGAQESLESQENSGAAEEDEDSSPEKLVAEPATIEQNALDTISQVVAHATMFRKLFKASRFDRDAETRLANAIDRMIAKWQSAKSALARKDRQ